MTWRIVYPATDISIKAIQKPVSWIASSHQQKMELPLQPLVFLALIATALITKNCAEKPVYVLATAGGQWGSDSYIDDNGAHTGFYIDLAVEVCNAGAIDCRIVHTQWWNCWNFQKSRPRARGGVGLLDGWFDGCIGATVTHERMQVFKFSQSFLRPFSGFFYVRSDYTFRKNDLKTMKIGFVTGSYNDEKCIAQETGVVVPVVNVIYYKFDEVIDALISRKIDAIFYYDNLFNNIAKIAGSKVKKVEDMPVTCPIRGGSIMTRKDSDLPEKWNEGFSKLVSSGRYRELCEESNRKHATGGRPPPLCMNLGIDN